MLLNALSKYGCVMSIGIQNTLVYRFNYLARAGLGLIPLSATLYLWQTVYGGSQSGSRVADYSLTQMVSYYLLVTIVDALTAVNEDDWQIAQEIRDGTISQFLLKPIDYLAYRFCLFITGRGMYTLMACVPVGLYVAWHGDRLVPMPGPAQAAAFVLSVALTACLQFLMSFSMALLSFWVLEVSTFIFILFAFEYAAGGHLFPLDILPPTAQAVLSLTPFPYQMFFPVSIYLGRVTGPALWQGLAIQAVWVMVAYAAARWMWRNGIRKYAAFGG
jgi:ABC-2 type transport system permease protein